MSSPAAPEPRLPMARSLVHRVSDLQALMRERLWLQVILGMILGVACGVLIAPESGIVAPEVSRVVSRWLALPGHLFLATIKFIVVPLVVASVIRGIAAGESAETLGALGLRTVAFFLATTVLAVIIGFAAGTLLQPGQYIDSGLVRAALGASGTSFAAPAEAAAPALPAGEEIPRHIVRLLPTNFYSALAEGELLQIVIGAAILGVALLALAHDQARPILDLLASVQAVTMVIVRWVMRFAPLAVFGLLAEISARIGLDAIIGMTAYVGAVLAGLAALFFVYLGLVVAMGRRSPLKFLAAVRDVMLMAFSTSSSAAVMPLSLRAAEERLRIRDTVSRFVIPLGTTINMGGTALYQAVAALFLAQVFSIDIGTVGLLLILVTATGAAIGSPGTPGVGIVVLASILETAGIPAAGIALILGVDRILDMCRTAVNVMGDLVACVVVNRYVESTATLAAGSAAERA